MEENLDQTNLPVIETTSSPVAPKPPFGSWWKVGILVVGVLLAGSIAYAGYQFSQKQTPPTSQPVSQPTPTSVVVTTPTLDPTANWKAYTTKYLSFKYPQDWIQPFKINDAGCIILNPPEKKDGELIIELIICPPILYLMDPGDETFNKSPERLANDAASSSRIKEGLMSIIKRESIVLDKHNAIRLEFQSRDKDIKEIDVYVDKVLFPPGSDGERPLQSVLGTLEITYGILDPSKMEYAENTFNQILSTFQFLD